MIGFAADILKKHYMSKVASNGMELGNIPEESRTIELCAQAVSASPNASQFIPLDMVETVMQRSSEMKEQEEKALELDQAVKRNEVRMDASIGRKREKELLNSMALVDVKKSASRSRRTQDYKPHTVEHTCSNEGTKANLGEAGCKPSYIRQLITKSVSPRDRSLDVDITLLGSAADGEMDELELNISGKSHYGTKTPSRRVVVVLENALVTAGDKFQLTDRGWDSSSNLRQVRLLIA